MSITVPNQTLALDQWVVEVTIPVVVNDNTPDEYNTNTQRRYDILTTSFEAAIAVAKAQHPGVDVTVDAVRKSTSQRQFILDVAVVA